MPPQRRGSYEKALDANSGAFELLRPVSLPPSPELCSRTIIVNPRHRQALAARIEENVLKRSVINPLYNIPGGHHIKLHMNGSDKRRWFRSTPRVLAPRIGRILVGPKTTPIAIVTSSNCRTAARDDSALVPGPAVSVLASATRGNSTFFGWRRTAPPQERREPAFPRSLVL
jgi:hypothetical protein